MSIKSIIAKYESLLKEDKYEELFNKCSPDERRELINLMYNKAGIDPLESMTTIPRGLFESTDVSIVVIPDNIVAIENEAFKGSSVREVYMSDAVKDIGYNVFMNCANLSKVRLSRSIEKIPNGTFLGCLSLEKIFIPDSVTLIGGNAFKNCSDNLLIVANFRTGDDKIKFSGAEVDFFKQHMKFKRR